MSSLPGPFNHNSSIPQPAGTGRTGRLERMIDKGMAEGLEDDKIIDNIMTGGDKTFSRKDIDRME